MIEWRIVFVGFILTYQLKRIKMSASIIDTKYRPDSASTSDFYGQSDCFQHTNGKKECILWKSVHPGEFRTKTTSVNCTRDNPPIVDNPGFFVDVELHICRPFMRTPNFYIIFSAKSKFFQQNPKNKPSFYRFRSSHNFILSTV